MNFHFFKSINISPSYGNKKKKNTNLFLFIKHKFIFQKSNNHINVKTYKHETVTIAHQYSLETCVTVFYNQ